MRPASRQSTRKARHRYSNGAARLFHAIDRALEDSPIWETENKAVDRALLTLMGTLVAALVLGQLAMHYHISVSWFGA